MGEGRREWNGMLTCNCVSILLDDPVICELSFRKWAISRRNSFRFIPSINDDGTKRSRPNSRLQKLFCECQCVRVCMLVYYSYNKYNFIRFSIKRIIRGFLCAHFCLFCYGFFFFFLHLLSLLDFMGLVWLTWYTVMVRYVVLQRAQLNSITVATFPLPRKSIHATNGFLIN